MNKSKHVKNIAGNTSYIYFWHKNSIITVEILQNYRSNFIV